jgi:serine/threonine-protein kinase HipA
MGAGGSASFDVRQYQPTDTLYLWWLGRPEQPVRVGSLHTARASRGVSLRYSADWLKAGFALSEDLPLIDREFLPLDPETAAGAVDDARPDRWGERVIRQLDHPPRLSLMEFLFYAGDERFGALGVSVSDSEYLPRYVGPLPDFADIDTIERLVQQILNAEPVLEAQRRLIVPGVTLGGARPKALLRFEGHEWVLKFNEPGDVIDTSLVEHATMTLAAKAGIRVAQTRAIPLAKGQHAIAVQRFDRGEGGRRRHALSANVALKAAGESLGYPELARWLRRQGDAENQFCEAHRRELFRRMVFNILMDNTDDHEKNHAVLMTSQGGYELSPAFDVLPSAQSLGYQQMRVGTDMHDSTLKNAFSEHAQFALKADEARQEIQSVGDVVSTWKTHFAETGARAGDIDFLARHIDKFK